MELLLFLLVVYIIIYTHRKNNDIYEYFYPDERQYTTCSGKVGKGETNISMKEIKPTPPTKGFLSSILGVTEEKSTDKHFEIHMCVPFDSLKLNSIYGANVIDNDVEEDPTDERFYKYHNGKPLDNYSVLYPEIFHDQFLENRKVIIEGDDRF
jgi:hypothetical protein|tara:strand:+ start:1271 stop:1729 length:459 start_codon:yes stop_codon:yes gene_type:complete